jgi:hypothetical protein
VRHWESRGQEALIQARACVAGAAAVELLDLPHVAPMLSYEDVAAAAEWLCAAFGFREMGRFENGGRVTHVNLAAGDGS